MANLSEEEKEALEIKRSFEYLDVNKDGRISSAEVVRGTQIHGLNPTRKEADEMIAELDTSGNGYVEFEEYEKFMKKELKKLDYEQKLFMDAFKKFDKDGNGYVSFEELKKALCGTGDRMSDEDVKMFFDEADLNQDGKIDYKEFVTWFSSA
ncbi:calmodulin-like [Saccostrea echinata]|uniref:calmodulin-like n=1 Tax=Saccostrea echinata TaxID=191078 RepID=UPI002A83C095|nr:calmodulin-like [Saccostrea echinata]